MGIENLGLDFDGVLRKWPCFIRWYFNFLSPNDLLVRAKLFHLRRLTIKICMNIVPIILDGKLIEEIKQQKPKKIIVISGRCHEKEKQQVRKLLRPYLQVDKYCFRENCKELEHQFKERILKTEHVTCFIEDRDFIVKYLQSKGFRVIRRDGNS